MSSPSVTPIRWFGGKTTIAPQIVAMMPAHELYCEPFAGGLGVLYAKSRAKIEVINDLHSDLVNLYRVMRNDPEAFCRSVELMPFAREEYRRGFYVDPGLPDIERAALFYLYTRACHGGAAGRSSIGGFAIMSPESRSSRASQFQTTLDTLPLACERLRGLVIENRDGLELIAQYGRYRAALIYADPPYFLGGDRTSPATKYRHEFSAEEHTALAAVANECKAKVMISYYDDPRVRDLYPDWHLTRIAQHRTQKRDRTRCPEIVLSNFQPAPTLFEQRTETKAVMA